MVKQHIEKLPVVDYSAIIDTLPDENTNNARIGISVPLFFSSSQPSHALKDMQTKRFQNIHCKGAIWAVISFLKNTDLGEKGVRGYFHIEDKIYNKAMPVFRQFNVPDKYIRKMQFKKGAFPRMPSPGAVRFGKRYIALFDNKIPNITHWLVADSDFFVCTTGSKLPLYDIYNCKIILENPLPLSYKLIQYEKRAWLQAICWAAGIKYTPNVKEADIFEKFGLKHLLKLADTDERKERMNAFVYSIVFRGGGNERFVIRPEVVAPIISFPIKHPISDFIRKHIWTCFGSESIIACYTMTKPLIGLQSMINTIAPRDLDSYRAIKDGVYFHHLLYGTENCDSYFTRFYNDLTRYIDVPNVYSSEFEMNYGQI